MPVQIRVARVLLALIAVAHGAAIVALVLLQGVLAEQISGARPALSSSDVSKLVLLELVRTVSFHALLVVVCGIYAAKIGSGNRRVFRIVVASQVLSVVFGIVTWFTSPDVVRFVTPAFVVTALAVLLLLLGSASARAFFSARSHADVQATPSR
ncbi:hypothetical protein QFZ53_000698 [Microbacterium natoriense]|uniref:Integral membrane protein n=1 Tax=Microbacterium natoriense TaxID=284570 RepID=A0AAW8EVV0_9MICO|nr:hypothetical protein [Microbacterium natoriense]MDQ0646502.1 hypothetical protein [Microbacterium natoriense]